MKKKFSLRLVILTLIFAMTVSIGLSACGDSDSTPSTPVDSSSPSDNGGSNGNGEGSGGNGGNSGENGGNSSDSDGVITTPDLEF